MKLHLKCCPFDRVEEIQQESHNVLGTLREQDFQHAFQQWQWRWDRCVAAQGDNFEGVLPKLKSSKYILVYRSSLGTFRYTLVYIYIGCPRGNVPDFGRVFLMLKYTDITQNTYVQS